MRPRFVKSHRLGLAAFRFWSALVVQFVLVAATVLDIALP
jgi:hypothetical protein